MAKSLSIKVDLSTGAGIFTGPIAVGVDDTLYYRFVSSGASAPSTAVITAFSKRHIDEPGLSLGTLVINGTANMLTVSGYDFISFTVTTTQAAKEGTLYIFIRKTRE